MKRIVRITVLFLLAAGYGYSFDFGGNLEDSTYYYYDDSSSMYHSDNLSLWVRTPIWKNADVYFQGSYTYTTDDAVFFDLDYLRIESNRSSAVDYTLGRISVSDFSGYVFNHKLDGMSLAYNIPWGVIRVSAGYTGLLFDNSSSLIMTLADQNDDDTATLYSLAAPRFVSGLEVLLPDLFLHQDMHIGVWSQVDMRNKDDVVAEGTTAVSSIGGKLNTQYFGAGVSGPLSPSLYFDGFAYLGTGRTLSYIDGVYTYKPVVSFLGSAGIRYYSNAFFYSRISFRFLYSSGDSDYHSSFLEGNTNGDGTNFIPVSRQSLALVFSPQLGNIFFTRLSYSLKPLSEQKSPLLRNIQTELTANNFFRSTTGQISEGGINPSSSALYLGTEVDGTVNFRPYSDFGVSLSGGVFIPNNGTDGAFLESQQKVAFLARLGLSFSF